MADCDTPFPSPPGSPNWRPIEHSPSPPLSPTPIRRVIRASHRRSENQLTLPEASLLTPPKLTGPINYDREIITTLRKYDYTAAEKFDKRLEHLIRLLELHTSAQEKDTEEHEKMNEELLVMVKSGLPQDMRVMNQKTEKIHQLGIGIHQRMVTRNGLEGLKRKVKTEKELTEKKTAWEKEQKAKRLEKEEEEARKVKEEVRADRLKWVAIGEPEELVKDKDQTGYGKKDQHEELINDAMRQL